MKETDLKCVSANLVPRGFRNEVDHEEFFELTGRRTKDAAEYILASVRRTHPASCGWVEISSEVALNPDGEHWDVRRYHVKLCTA